MTAQQYYFIRYIYTIYYDHCFPIIHLIQHPKQYYILWRISHLSFTNVILSVCLSLSLPSQESDLCLRLVTAAY